ncbi:MAG TPA: hypothetical protein PK308_10995, partial [Phycisphaerales bacterium]|nr:hypothetical protein [Phycisphaerales bacterium]
MVTIWIVFILFVLVMLALDLGVFNREAHVISSREAVRWVAFFVSLALVFNVAVYFIYSKNWMGMGDQYRSIIQRDATRRSAAMHAESAG